MSHFAHNNHAYTFPREAKTPSRAEENVLRMHPSGLVGPAPHTIPGTPETAAITYQEADPARLKALEEQLKEAQESDMLA